MPAGPLPERQERPHAVATGGPDHKEALMANVDPSPSDKNARMVELTATGDTDQVEARLREALDSHGLQLFARIDHATGARKAEVELEPNVLLIFGNPSVGTPLMQADPRVGIELPLRMLIWQDPHGTHIGTSTPASWPTATPSTATSRRSSGRPRCSPGWPPRQPAERSAAWTERRAAPTDDHVVQPAVALPSHRKSGCPRLPRKSHPE